MVEIASFSYSTLNAWFSCPKAMQLKKFGGARERPGFALVGGRVVHTVSELWEREYEAEKSAQ